MIRPTKVKIKKTPEKLLFDVAFHHKQWSEVTELLSKAWEILSFEVPENEDPSLYHKHRKVPWAKWELHTLKGKVREKISDLNSRAKFARDLLEMINEVSEKDGN